ncbi:MAG: nucleotide exchange factor GrpE [Candidatus Anstonellaceae archaeon]
MAEKKSPSKEDAASKPQDGAKAAQQTLPEQQAISDQEKAAQQTDDISKKLSAISDQFLRLSAEFDNYKKRTAKEKQELIHSSEAKLMLRMIPVYEEIELAQKEVGKLPEGEVKKGVLLVLSKLRQSFEKEGLQEMKLEGEKFDPYKHDCALQEESDKPEGEIVKVIQKGYTFKGEIIKHAVVSISAGKKKEDENAAKGEAKDEGAKKA